MFTLIDCPVDTIENFLAVGDVRHIAKLERWSSFHCKCYVAPSNLLFESGKDLQRILAKNLLSLLRAQPGDTFNLRPYIVVPPARAGVVLGARARSFGAEEATIRSDDFEKEL